MHGCFTCWQRPLVCVLRFWQCNMHALLARACDHASIEDLASARGWHVSVVATVAPRHRPHPTTAAGDGYPDLPLASASAAGVDVTITGDTNTGLVYSITFDPLANPGDLPLLRVASAANLTGSNASVAVRLLNNGSLEQWFTPVPVELLQLPVAAANTVQVQLTAGWAIHVTAAAELVA